MKTLSILALIAATASPAIADARLQNLVEIGGYAAVAQADLSGDQLAAKDPSDRLNDTFTMKDPGDRKHDTFAAKDPGDRKHDTFAAKDPGDRAERIVA